MGGRVHGPAEGNDIRLQTAFRPGRIGGQHRNDAMAVLLGDVEWIAPEHQVPTHGGMARGVGPAVADGQAFERESPVTMDLVQTPTRLAVGVEEQVLVLNPADSFEPPPQAQLALQHRARSGVEDHTPILVDLRAVSIDACDAGLRDAQHAVEGLEGVEAGGATSATAATAMILYYNAAGAKGIFQSLARCPIGHPAE